MLLAASRTDIGPLDGRYRLVEPVARGSSGQVWHAFDERLRRPVAVKLLNADLAAPDRDRAYREAQALASLSHAHVAAVYDCGIADDRPYLVLELIDGRSLAEVLATRGRLPWELSVACCAQVAAGLAAAHGRGVVHRDVTAANVMLTPAGVKLIDFGISAVEGEPEVDPDGGLRGTPAYAAPERLNDATVAASGDVYSLGVLLYRALSGGLPWQATTPQQLLALQHSTEPAPLPQIEGLPGRIADVCMRCLDTDPGERPTAAQLAADLADATGTPAFAELAALGVHSAGVPTLTHLLPRGASGTRTTRRRRPRTRLVTLVAGVLAAATVAWWATDWAPADAPTPGRAVVAAPATAHPPFAECAVEYQLLHDDGRRFTAAVTVTNLDSTVLRGWSVALRLPGDQRIDPVRSPGWTQKGDLVMAPPQRDVLNPGGSARRTVTGLHPGVTRLPTVFTLDGSPCAVTLLGQTGQALSATSGAVLAGGTAEGGGSGGGGGSRSRGAGKGKPTR